MLAQKFNLATKKYEPFEIPDESVLISTDMNLKIKCAECKKSITFGEGYSSQVIHNSAGFGYSVCSDCHEKEISLETINKYIF